MKMYLSTLMVVCVVSTFNSAFGQTANKPTIAVALPNIENLDVSPEIIAKLMQIELIKLDTYSVYDEFDMQEAMDADMRFSSNCFGRNCLIDLGKAADAEYIVSASILSFGGRIVFTTKIIEVASGNIYKSGVREFIDNKREVQRMIEVIIKDLHDVEMHAQHIATITHDQQPVIKDNVNRINNQGPRIGYSILTGRLNEFATRSEREGGLDIFPGVSMVGYQFEKQYIGTENFTALGEVLVTVSGLEQGVFLPSAVFMNGFRFGKKGWEIAFGPGFGINRTSRGFFDVDGIYGEKGSYWTSDRFNDVYNADPEASSVSPSYPIEKHLDNRGKFGLSTRWVMAVGRTYRIGGLNVPVNIFYSNMKRAGMVGVSIGFNSIK